LFPVSFPQNPGRRKEVGRTNRLHDFFYGVSKAIYAAGKVASKVFSQWVTGWWERQNDGPWATDGAVSGKWREKNVKQGRRQIRPLLCQLGKKAAPEWKETVSKQISIKVSDLVFKCRGRKGGGFGEIPEARGGKG